MFCIPEALCELTRNGTAWERDRVSKRAVVISPVLNLDLHGHGVGSQMYIVENEMRFWEEPASHVSLRLVFLSSDLPK